MHLQVALAGGVWLWYVFALPPLESGWLFFFVVVFTVVSLHMAVWEKQGMRPIQWIMGIVTLICFYLMPYCSSLPLWFIVLIWIFWPYGFAADQSKRGRRKTAVALAVFFFGFGAAAFSFAGLKIVHGGYMALTLPHTADQVQTIEFKRHGKAPVLVSSASEIRKIITSWRMYVWATSGRFGGRYDVEAHQPWTCEIRYRDGRVKTFTVALGLRRTVDSLCVIDTTPNRIPGLFGFGKDYQSPDLYKALYPLLWTEPGEK
ncbi:hypothetical protein [uncultured Victivallis sp.]|uniref:hypothetical protein n=1 Tax=uncultured Victivallis sp. TaxID=354118 RepID=UPI00258FAA8B|nr:hypothetical protein [uncultured Victivallis sp.]